MYHLKRDYGFPIDLYYITGSSTDIETGIKTLTKEKIHIRKCIVLPNDIQRKFSYDIAFLAANKNFTYGGTWDQNMRGIIIDYSDLPKNFRIQYDHYFIYNNQKYEIKKISDSEDKRSVYIVMRGVFGDKLNQILEIRVFNRLSLRSELTVNP